ncbi:hypothetical protein BC962_2213 [Gillisia mitskevichiae]|uniref:O-antigen ligase-like membrane protein n=1 Tax=Gillisia mitskevichiae TaxID=270921 RepID=A0A495PVB9_9FLAO|nr:hypothetical protein [Gillisia mitskevichiae]RKS53946.1 hypothetical protein BC962_2213 [Gillisia mitskevichiae]
MTMNFNDNNILKKYIWLYFYLLIFEGALRKWVLPGLSEPLLIIRDPLAIYILFLALRNNLWKFNAYVSFVIGITILSFIITLFIGHGNIPVAIYGLRIGLIHFPVIFVIGNVFNKEDVLNLGKKVLWISIGMTILVTIQFYSPQSAWINQGVGGMSGSGFGEVSGFFRVPGTFSFTNGLSLFYGLSAAYIFYFWLMETQISKVLLITASLALLIAIPLSISRTIFFETILSLAFMIAISGKKPQAIKRFVGLALVLLTVFIVLSNFNFFQTGKRVFTERMVTANEAEGGVQGTVIDRFLGGMYSAVIDPENSYAGLGLGIGSKVASKLLTGNASVYLLPEGEWGRIVGEMGFILGIFFILIRMTLVFEFFNKTWNALNYNNVLPWMLLSFGAIIIMQGQWSQPTALGFSVLTGGLILSSLREKE